MLNFLKGIYRYVRESFCQIKDVFCNMIFILLSLKACSSFRQIGKNTQTRVEKKRK